MQELDSYSGMHGLNEVGIREIGNVLCVVLSMRVWCMCCGSVWLITQYGSTVYTSKLKILQIIMWNIGTA